MRTQNSIGKLRKISNRISIVPVACQVLLFICCTGSLRADIAGLERVASGLNGPIFVTHAPGDTARLFIVERGGAIRILDLSSGAVQGTPFLTIPDVETGGEGGLLGLAFHPDYQNNGRFYVNLTVNDGGGGAFSTHIREYSVSDNPNVADANSERLILRFVQPQANHNGGWIGFSPNNEYLYIATGDGGGGNDDDAGHTPGTGNAQDITSNLLGKILRVDVNGDDFPTDANRNYSIPESNPFVGEVGDDEIFAYGLRNPFRAGFDRVTGDLWIGDVGQGAREEIDFIAASSGGGENFGWRLREGTIQTPSSVGGARPPGNVDPVYDYDRDDDAFGGTVVSGGYVYRGPDPEIQGKYFFFDSRNSADPADDNYWMFDPDDPYGTVENIDSLLVPNEGSPSFPVSFGEDAVGNLYIAYLVSGDVYRIQTTAGVPIPPPQLSIRFQPPASIVLSWPTNSTGFTLESKTNLISGEWSGVSPDPVVQGTNYVVTNAVNSSVRFFRLRQ